jgi:hypothetical protein
MTNDAACRRGPRCVLAIKWAKLCQRRCPPQLTLPGVTPPVASDDQFLKRAEAINDHPR